MPTHMMCWTLILMYVSFVYLSNRYIQQIQYAERDTGQKKVFTGKLMKTSKEE